MAIVNSEGKSISYECTDLIGDLKEDLREFGSDIKVIQKPFFCY